MSEGSERGDLLDSLTLDEPVDTVPSSPEAETPSSEPAAASPDAASPSAPEASPAAAASDPGSAPQPDTARAPLGEPYSFSLDGRPYPVEGVTVMGDRVSWPKTAWDEFLNQVGSRQVWTGMQQGYQRGIAEREQRLQSVQQELTRAKADQEASAQFVDHLLKLAENPEAFVEALDDIRVNMPRWVAEQKLAAMERMQQEAETHRTEEQRAQEAQQLEQSAVSHLSQVLGRAVSEPKYQPLTEERITLGEFWKLYQDDIYQAVPPDQVSIKQLEGWQVLGQGAGAVVMWSPAAVQQILDTRLANHTAYRQKFEKAAQVEQRNAEAVKPTAKPPAPRTATGQFTKEPATPKPFSQKRKEALAMLDELELPE